jgi:hypothetical protein
MKSPTTPGLTAEQSDLAINFYEAVRDFLRESFEQIAKRVVPNGFGKLKSGAAFKREAKTMFELGLGRRHLNS